jgi:methionyl-tRNA synthetase
LSSYEPFVRRLLAERPAFIQPAGRRNEVIAFVDRGLEDVSITRARLDWGIPFPSPSADGRHQVIYVWFDALPNYLTAVGFPESRYEAQWPAQVHVVGKDITRFHCVLWPAILHAAGLALPEHVWVHGFLSVDGRRLSKSGGVWVELREAIDRFGVDALRYYLLREIPFDGDGDFSWRRLEARYDADLANTLGNLVSRVIALVDRHCPDGRLPPIELIAGDAEHALAARESAALGAYRAAFAGYRPHRALDAVFDVLAAANEYVNRTTPWVLARDTAQRTELDRVLATLVGLIARQAVLLGPAIPGKAEDIWRALGGPGSVHDQRLANLSTLNTAGWRITRCRPLFPRTDRSAG